MNKTTRKQKVAGRLKLMLLSVLLLFANVAIFAQERTVSGTIIDNTGGALPGVNVIIKGTTTGTVSDINGKYQIKVDGPAAVLVYKYVGYTTQEIAVGEQTTIAITLFEEVTEMNEVVVIGYGVQKKKLNTGANLNVSGKNIQGLNTSSTMDALKGISPGVSISQTSGQPGSGTKVNIRGIGTIGNSAPLYIVDGVAVGNIDNLSPADIESVDVLKDAASAAIYGSRAANGVILVTTKKGKEGKVNITYDTYYGIQNVYKGPDMLNAQDYAMIMTEGKLNDKKKDFTYATLVPNWDKIKSGESKGTNWFDEIKNEDAPVQSHALNISGGSKKSVYSFGISHLAEKGILGKQANSDYKRLNLRLNTEHKLIEHNGNDVLVFGENLTFTNSKRPSVRTGGIYWNDVRAMISASPFMPIYNDSGKYQYAIPWNTSEANPIALMEYNGKDNYNDNNSIVGNAYLDISPIKSIKIHSSIGINNWYGSSRSWVPAYSLSTLATTPRDKVTQSMYNGFSWTSTNTVSYYLTSGSHNFSAMVGNEMVKTTQDLNLSGTNENSSFQDGEHAYLDNVDVVDATYTRVSGSDKYGAGLMSYFGRVSYDYKETYLMTLVMRADGSSNFAKGKRWGKFPSVAAGWVMSNESFMSNTSDWLNFLKLRASWGRNGNQSIEPFQYLASIGYNQANYYFGTDKTIRTIGGYPPIIPNPAVTWETSEQTNIGTDINFFKSKLQLNADWYRKVTRDWLLVPPARATDGANPAFINGGEITNSGIELVVRWNSNIGDLKYGISASLANNSNEVTNIERDDKLIRGPSSVLSQGTSDFFRAEVGYPIGYFWGYKTDGIIQDSAEAVEYMNKTGQTKVQPGDVRFVDNDGSGTISDSDKVMIGNPNPDIIYGLQLNLEFKGFYVNLTTNGQAGNQIAKSYHSGGDSPLSNYSSDILGRWHGKGTSNKIPRIASAPHKNTQYISDLYIEDGDFYKIANLTVGYNLKELFKGMPLEELRIYFTAKNLYTFTNYSGMDPEVGYGPSDSNNRANDYPWASGIDLGLYPASRTYMVGLSLKF